jgi:hypothetical protein
LAALGVHHLLGMQRDAGIAATSPNAAVQHCHAENASPCEDSCAFCYAVLGARAPVLCPHCSRRKLCCDECRRRDWALHQHYCGSAGEKNVDWAIRDCSSDGRGYGVVALRDFSFGEVIMAERCVASSPEDIGALEPPSVRAAAMLLFGDTLEEKYEGYAMGRLGLSRGIFLDMGRVNHACVPTPGDHTWLDSRECKILTACGHIPKGMEITFSYRGDMLLPAAERSAPFCACAKSSASV